MILHYLKLIWHRRRKNAFLTAELVLAFLVVFGVLAFAIRQFSKLVVPEGFNTENVHNIIPSIAGDLDSITYKNMREQFKQEILNLPDVRNLTLATEVTPYGESSWSTFTKLGDSEAMVDYIMCDENFADVWQVKMVSGNFFTEGDLVGKYLPVVVNQLFVDNFLKDTTALGYIFEMMGKEVIIQGICQHFKYRGKFREEVPLVLAPIYIGWGTLGLITVATYPEADDSVMKKMHDITARIIGNHEVRIDQVAIKRKIQNRSAWAPLSGLFALAAFILINIGMGLIGIMRYNISRRKSEIGLRKAVGASNSHIRRQFVGEMLVLTSLAMGIGLIFAIQVIFLDALTMPVHLYWYALLTTILIILGIVIISSVVPSSQAAALDPAVTLYEE